MKTAITILNWNSSPKTIKCLESLNATITDLHSTTDTTIFILDNGSEKTDWLALKEYLQEKPWINLYRSEINTGFAGGQNILIGHANKKEFDYIWVLNNDTEVQPKCLENLIILIQGDPVCGAVSPVISNSEAPHDLGIMGGIHRWDTSSPHPTQNLDKCREMEADEPHNFWITGAALLLRVSALKKIGLFDASYFAYYEDNDLCARLSQAGYRCRVSYEAQLIHRSAVGHYADRKSYYFYFMARNEILFWLKNTPRSWRKPIRYQVLQKVFTEAYRLEQSGMREKFIACLAGGWDGIFLRNGPPVLKFKVSLIMMFIYKVSLLIGKPKNKVIPDSL